ncbi:hypothetical protein JST97_01940 [bacterium]|nr:hypothetical protein [bacterium]
MDPLATLNQAGAPGLNLTVTSLTFSAPSLSDAASCRCGSGLAPASGLSPFGQPGAVDPMTQGLLRTEMMMNQTLMQLMQLMVQLMANRGGQSGSSSAIPSASGSSGAASGAGGSGGGSSGAGASATAGMPGATATGSKLAEIARAEASNGDSSGGLCYRDVGRDLAKIGINVSGASAYMAADQLAKNPKVKEMKVSQSDLPKLPAGAIVVWDRGAGHEHGHISIATGDGKEASDLMRNQITNYGTSFRVFMPQ